MDAFSTQPARKWYEIWIDVLIHPGFATFQNLLKEPNISSNRGFTWVAVTSFISFLIGILVSMVESSLNPNVTPFPIWYLLCGSVATPVLAIVGLAIMAWIYDGIAKRFGGSGEYHQMVFCLAAIQSPFALIGIVLGWVMIPFYPSILLNPSAFGTAALPSFSPAFCLLWFVSIGIGIYSMVLYINAIRAVENLEPGKAVMTYFTPVVIIFVLSFMCVCLVTLLFPQIGGR